MSIDFSKINLSILPKRGNVVKAPPKKGRIDYGAIKLSNIYTPAKVAPKPVAIPKNTGKGAPIAFQGRPLVTPVEQQRMKSAEPTPSAVPAKTREQSNLYAPSNTPLPVQEQSFKAFGKYLSDLWKSPAPGKETVRVYPISEAYEIKHDTVTGQAYQEIPFEKLDWGTQAANSKGWRLMGDTLIFLIIGVEAVKHNWATRVRQDVKDATDGLNARIAAAPADSVVMPESKSYEHLVSAAAAASKNPNDTTIGRTLSSYASSLRNANVVPNTSVGMNTPVLPTSTIAQLSQALANPTTVTLSTDFMRALPPAIAGNLATLGVRVVQPAIPMPAGLVHSTTPAIPMGGETQPSLAAGKKNVWEAVGDLVNKAKIRSLQDEAGQSILEDIDNRGDTPTHVSEVFWKNIYPSLPPKLQNKFNSYVVKLGGFKIGDVIGTNADGTDFVARSWNDLADFLDIGNDVAALQGTDRGYVALMEMATQRLSSISPAEVIKRQELPSPPETPVVTEPYIPHDKYQVEHPLLERPQPAVPGVKTTKSMDTIMAEEEAAGRKLETTPRAVDKTIPAIDVKRANLVDVTAKVDLQSVQVKFPSADKVVLDTKRRTVMFMSGTTPLEAIAVDKPQLKDWYGIEGAKLLGEITRPVPAFVGTPAPVVAQVAPTAITAPIEVMRTGKMFPTGAYVADIAAGSMYAETRTGKKYTLPVGTKLADTTDPVIAKALVAETLKDPSLTPEERTRLVGGLAEPYIDYILVDELPIAPAATRLGYDAMRVAENEDMPGEATSIFVMDIKKLTPTAPPLSKMETTAAPAVTGETPEAIDVAARKVADAAQMKSPAYIRNKKITDDLAKRGIVRGSSLTENSDLREATQVWMDAYDAEEKRLTSSPDLSTTPQKGPSAAISNQKTSISTPTPVPPRGGTQTGAGAVKWGKWIDAVGSRRTSGVGTGQVDIIKTPITYRLGSGDVSFRWRSNSDVGPWSTTTGKALQLKGDTHTLFVRTIVADNPKYNEYIVTEGRSGYAIGGASPTVKGAIANAQENVLKHKNELDTIIEGAVTKNGEVANPASVPTALITSTSAPASAPSLGNASTLPAGMTGNIAAPNNFNKSVADMTEDEFVNRVWSGYPTAPAGYTLLYHATPEWNVDSIIKAGLSVGVESTDGRKGVVWSTTEPTAYTKGSALVVFKVPTNDPAVTYANEKERMVRKNIPPEDIVQVYHAVYGEKGGLAVDTRQDILWATTEPGSAGRIMNYRIASPSFQVAESPSTIPQNTPAHGLIDYSRIELNGTTSQTSPSVLASVSNTGKRSRVETKGFDNYVQNTTGTKETSLSPFAKFKEGRDLQVRRYENEFDGLMKTPAGAEWMTLAIEADEVLREEYARPFSINEAGERVYAEGEFAPAILNRYLKQYGPNFGKFLQHLQRAGISTEPTLGLSAEKEALKQKHIYDARMSLVNFQKNEPQLFTAYMSAADELGNANALLAEFYKGMISPETYANDKANPHYYVSLSAGRTDRFDRSGVAPLERTHGLTDLEHVVEPLEGLKAVYVDAIRAQGINNAKREAVRSNKNSEVATTELSDSIVHLKENGVERAYDVHDTNVTQSVKNLTLKKPEVPTWEKHLVKDPTTSLRFFATGLNPAFGLFNIIRDFIQSIFTVPSTLTGLVKGTIRAFKSPQLSQWFDSYRDPMMSKGTKALEALKVVTSIITYPNEIGESLTRSVIAESVVDRGGTYLDQLHAYYASTGFFTLHGTFFNDFIPSCIPFTRATIAVVRAAYRNTFLGLPIGGKGGTFSGKQGAEKLAGRNLATIIFTIISALAIKEAGKEKEYKLLRDRASYFYFPTPSGAWVKLPVPIGFQPIKSVVDSLFGYKSDPLGVAGQTLNVIPGLEAFMLPPSLALFLQYKFNINFFTGAAITAAVGTPAANPLEAALMKTGMDEGQAAFLVRAFLADIPSQVQYVFDMVGQGSSTQAFPASKRFIVKDPTTSSNAAVDDFYALVDAAARSDNPTLKHYVNARAVNIGKLLKNAKLYPADAKIYITTATDNIIATFVTIAENPRDYAIKKFGPFSWRPSGNYEELAP